VVVIAAAAGLPALVGRFAGHRNPLATLATALVRRADLSVTTSAAGRVDSSERTVIDCRLEQLAVGVRGNVMSGGGASTILSIVPDGTMVEKGDVLCVLDSTDYEEMLRQQLMTVSRAQADHKQAELNVEVARLALSEYQDGSMAENLKALETRIVLAEAESERATERLEWTRRMFAKGYAPKSQVTTDEFVLAKARNELEDGREALRLFRKYYAPKYLKVLENEIQGAEAVLRFQDARLQRNEERRDLLQHQVDSCTIKAPHDGFLIYANEERRSIQIEPGMMVRQRQKLFYLPDLAHMEVEALLHESVVNDVQPGMPAKVAFEGLNNRVLEGYVKSVAPLPLPQPFFTDLKYYVGIVTLSSVPSGLKPGMSAEVSIRTVLRPDVLTIPAEALTIEGGRDVCYVATEDHLERRLVKVGHHTRDLLEVTDGLDEGEHVVLDPTNADMGDNVVDSDRRPEEIDPIGAQ
jgi:HlyD family secretion protein